LVLPAV